MPPIPSAAPDQPLPSAEAIVISRRDFARMLSMAAAAPDREICGLLFGSGGRIAAIEAAANVAADPARAFEIDPARLIAAHRAARRGGPAIFGHYHSHPSGDARPSPRDHAAAMPGDLWLIIGGGVIRAWRATAAGFDEIALRFAEGC